MLLNLPEAGENEAAQGPQAAYEYEPDEDEIRKEADTQGLDGRFGAGLPRINDGSFLFLQHMISKLRDDLSGLHIWIVTTDSRSLTGNGASG